MPLNRQNKLLIMLGMNMAGSPAFYKYKSLENFEFLLDILLKERLYAADYLELNDPMEGVIKLDKTIPKEKEAEWERLVREHRIVCFTKNSDNTLMWSHYADGGRGCIIEFELLPDQYYHKISYLKKPEISEKELTSEKVIEILGYKQKPWKYEGEYRCILNNERYLPVNIKSITFGPRAPKDCIDMLQHILTLCKPNIKTKTLENSGLVKGIGFVKYGARTYVKSTDNPDDCLECKTNELLQREMVGRHRNWKNY